MKSKIGILVLFCAIIGVVLFGYMSEEPYSTQAIVDSVRDKYEVQSTQIGEYEDPSEGDPAIYIDVYNENNIPKIEKYLEKNLSQDDLEYYKIDVFPYESTGK